MFEKFTKIKSIGRFRDCCPIGDVTFRKLTLLFAENGRGKTTLCSILRSLQTGEHHHISERHTLGSTELPEVMVRVDGNTVSYSSNIWSHKLPDISIFDTTFVNNNVFSGDYVDHNHKKNLYRIIVGQRGVQLSKNIEQLDIEIRNANKAIRPLKDRISRWLPDNVSLESYLGWKPIVGVEDRIAEKTSEIDSQQLTISKASEIRSKDVLKKIGLPSMPWNFGKILSLQLDGIHAVAEYNVKKHSLEHSMEDYGEFWLSMGIKYVKGNTCPFCGQVIAAKSIIDMYRSYFNAAYNSHKKKVTELRGNVVSSIGEQSIKLVVNAIHHNLTLIEFWKQFLEVHIPNLEDSTIVQAFERLKEHAFRLIDSKLKSPAEAIPLDTRYKHALAGVRELDALVAEYNFAVLALNSHILKLKKEMAKGVNIDVLKGELQELKDQKKRYDPVTIAACDEYSAAIASKITLESAKDKLKEELDQYCQQILQTYQESINSYLDQFNAGFRIANSKHQYTGGTPSSYFQLQINDHNVDLGDARTSPGTPCFKNTLSSGDKSALAFAFFMAAVIQDGNIEEKIVVLDDPFTSQDRFRRTCTQQLIRKLAESAKQVMVLSHDPHFLKSLWDCYATADTKALQMYRTSNGTTLGEWDIVAETQSTYLRNYSTLLNFYRERQGSPLDVARAIRPFLECMLRSHFPGHFEENEWLGDFIRKIRDSSPGTGLYHARGDLDEIEIINEYSKKYHHDQNPSASSEPVSEDELHGFVKRTLRLVGGC